MNTDNPNTEFKWWMKRKKRHKNRNLHNQFQDNSNYRYQNYEGNEYSVWNPPTIHFPITCNVDNVNYSQSIYMPSMSNVEIINLYPPFTPIPNSYLNQVFIKPMNQNYPESTPNTNKYFYNKSNSITSAMSHRKFTNTPKFNTSKQKKPKPNWNNNKKKSLNINSPIKRKTKANLPKMTAKFKNCQCQTSFSQEITFYSLSQFPHKLYRKQKLSCIDWTPHSTSIWSYGGSGGKAWSVTNENTKTATEPERGNVTSLDSLTSFHNDFKNYQNSDYLNYFDEQAKENETESVKSTSKDDMLMISMRSAPGYLANESKISNDNLPKLADTIIELDDPLSKIVQTDTVDIIKVLKSKRMPYYKKKKIFLNPMDANPIYRHVGKFYKSQRRITSLKRKILEEREILNKLRQMEIDAGLLESKNMEIPQSLISSFHAVIRNALKPLSQSGSHSMESYTTLKDNDGLISNKRKLSRSRSICSELDLAHLDEKMGHLNIRNHTNSSVRFKVDFVPNSKIIVNMENTRIKKISIPQQKGIVKMDKIKKNDNEIVTADSTLASSGLAASNISTSMMFPIAQELTEELDDCVFSLIRRLVVIQKKALKKNKSKSLNSKRLILGIREVRMNLKNENVKLVIISPDIEISFTKGGLWELVTQIIKMCKKQNVNYIFALDRKRLSRASNRLSSAALVAVLNYDGAEDLYQQVIEKFTTAKSSGCFCMSKGAHTRVSSGGLSMLTCAQHPTYLNSSTSNNLTNSISDAKSTHKLNKPPAHTRGKSENVSTNKRNTCVLAHNMLNQFDITNRIPFKDRNPKINTESLDSTNYNGQKYIYPIEEWIVDSRQGMLPNLTYKKYHEI
ncbi:hypothetical protein A3Q56_04346 [Intoshia linei]|uniref:Ribosomal protein eL8/eL30/eS12/Gadd45 domain-containing protein n=1 Tax=Intoshia linei TaxID=1819745 RepID=A0A177B0V7_9BILA|nr:hypothetical protein A3Q56_04346 [Intoshia linei]